MFTLEQELSHSYSTDVNSRNNTNEPVIVREIRKLPEIDSDTKERAVINYYTYSDKCNSRSPRGNKQIYWIFACVYRAYIDQNVYITPKRVASICGLEHQNIERALNTVPIEIAISPIELIQYYLHEMYLHKIVEDPAYCFGEIELMYNRIAGSVFGDEIIHDYPARNVAIGMITYYIDVINRDTRMTKEQEETIFESSTSCITRYRTKIGKVYNRI